MATVHLNWSDLNSGNAQEDGFKIYRSSVPLDLAALPAPLATLASGVVTYDDASATDGDNYYIVSAYRSGVERFGGQEMITLGAGASTSAYPAAVFSGGAVGVVLDPSIIGSLWQDVAGTIPVTTSGQPVALWQDQSGNGNNATQSVPARRPIYFVVGGKAYLHFDGTMWLEFATGVLNFGDISLHTAVKTSSVADVIIAAPHALNAHVGPNYFRWSMWTHPNTNVENRINGSAKVFLSPGIELAPTNIGFDTVAGSFYDNGVASSPFTPAVITYPNATAIRIGANGAGTERQVMDFYGLLAVDRGLTVGEIADVDTWMQTLI